MKINFFLIRLTKIVLVIFLSLKNDVKAQLLNAKGDTFSRADTLQGALSAARTCYDINYYHLDIKLDISNNYISGSNEFKFTATTDFTELQFDLFANLEVNKVIYKGEFLPFKREFNAVFVTFPQIKKDSKESFTVFYGGHPAIAKNAPWDGGLVYGKTPSGKAFVASACQKIGASIWWPNKDHLADEVDSMLISVSVPKGLMNVSNGRLIKTTDLKNGYTKFDWFVANPINNYSVSLNIANYTHFSDSYEGENGKLTLDYWVLPENLEKAKKQFGKNVKPMLKSLEYWFGPYPWYKDGYKLIETPYLGMEHQSAVAYGNKYQNGYLGKDLSGTGWGLKWDFIVIHESGHEWFGNSISCKDLADMWIHEGFTTYSESLFVESLFGKKAGQEYLIGIRQNIANKEPIQGHYGVNCEGSADMYPKGANMLNTIRSAINDDETWRKILRGLNKEFYHKTVNANDIIKYINQKSGMDFTGVFNQYLKFTALPVLEIKFINGKAMARWVADTNNFKMPVRLRVKQGQYLTFELNNSFSLVDIPNGNKDNLEIDPNYYAGSLFY